MTEVYKLAPKGATKVVLAHDGTMYVRQVCEYHVDLEGK